MASFTCALPDVRQVTVFAADRAASARPDWGLYLRPLTTDCWVFIGGVLTVFVMVELCWTALNWSKEDWQSRRVSDNQFDIH